MKAKRLLVNERGELITCMGAPIVIDTNNPRWPGLVKMLTEEHEAKDGTPTAAELDRQWKTPAYTVK